MGITEELRWTAAKLMNIGKFAVGSAVSEEGKLKGEASSQKKNLVVVVEEMQAKLEKLQQDKNNTEQQQQQSKMSSLTTQEKEHLSKHLSDDPRPQSLKSRMPEESGRRKIFIRSRL